MSRNKNSDDNRILAGGMMDFDEEEIENGEEDDEYGEEVVVSYACEDCDYRWEVTYDNEEDAYNENQYCPMCGTSNVTQI